MKKLCGNYGGTTLISKLYLMKYELESYIIIIEECMEGHINYETFARYKEDKIRLDLINELIKYNEGLDKSKAEEYNRK